MNRLFIVVSLLSAFVGLPMAAQQLAIGIAPTFDAGSEDTGPAIAQHLSLFIYRDLIKGAVYSPALLNPGGVYSSLDTSWLFDYTRDRPDLDLLLVTTLKPNTGKGALSVDVALLDAHTGATIGTWTATSDTDTKKGWIKGLGASLQSGLITSSVFEKSPLAAPTWRVADSIRDALPARTVGFTHTAVSSNAGTVSSLTPPKSADPCITHTHITYGYKHSASRSQLLLVNDLEQTSTLKDGISTFVLPEGPMLIQFIMNDAPYTMSKQQFYQLSTVHSCSKSTLVIDLGPQGDAHHHWE